MALVGMNLSGVRQYVSKDDPARDQDDYPTADATVFELGSLDVFLMSWVYDRAMSLGDNGQMALNTNATNLDAVRFGLKGWRNFRDEQGNDIPFKTKQQAVNGKTYTVVADESLQYLSIALVRELAAEIKQVNQVTKEEAKNSAAA